MVSRAQRRQRKESLARANASPNKNKVVPHRKFGGCQLYTEQKKELSKRNSVIKRLIDDPNFGSSPKRKRRRVSPTHEQTNTESRPSFQIDEAERRYHMVCEILIERTKAGNKRVPAKKSCQLSMETA